MRFTRNEHTVRKALSSLGGKMQEGVGMFSALPEAEKDADDEKGKGKRKATDDNKGKKDKKKKKKTKEELEAEKYTTIAGLKETFSPRRSQSALLPLPFTVSQPLPVALPNAKIPLRSRTAAHLHRHPEAVEGGRSRRLARRRSRSH